MARIKLTDLIMEAVGDDYRSIKKVVAKHSGEAFDHASEGLRAVKLLKQELREARQLPRRFREAAELVKELEHNLHRVRLYAERINKLMH